MVQLVDRVTYLPKDRTSLIDLNSEFNRIFKANLEEIKKKAQRINTANERVVITVTGRLSKNQSSNKINFEVACESEELKNKIVKALR